MGETNESYFYQSKVIFEKGRVYKLWFFICFDIPEPCNH